jgi:hypothetical protein
MEVSARRWGALVALGLLSTLPRAVNAAEPCKLLTVQEIGQVLGVPVSPPTPLGTTGCYWAGGSQRVNVVVRDATSWARITAPGPRITKTNVSGLGEAAQYSGMDNVWTLSVKQGASIIVLTVSGAKGPERQRSSEESLARLALLRL